MTAAPHPARAATQALHAAVRARDKNAWLALYAPDAVIEDPVGPSHFDPEGNGHRGPAARSAFWDKAIAPNDSIDFLFEDSFACANDETCLMEAGSAARRDRGTARATEATR